jgi:hypothetical protein
MMVAIPSHPWGIETQEPPSVQRLVRESGTTFIELAYLAILGRAADADGLAHYSQRLLAGFSKRNVLADIARSPERTQRSKWLLGITEEAPFITATYRAFLGREPGDIEVAQWRKELATGGSRIAVLQAISQMNDAKLRQEQRAAFEAELNQLVQEDGRERSWLRRKIASGEVLERRLNQQDQVLEDLTRQLVTLQQELRREIDERLSLQEQRVSEQNERQNGLFERLRQQMLEVAGRQGGLPSLLGEQVRSLQMNLQHELSEQLAKQRESLKGLILFHLRDLVSALNSQVEQLGLRMTALETKQDVAISRSDAILGKVQELAEKNIGGRLGVILSEPDNKRFIELAYREILGREPEPEGLKNSIIDLENGASRKAKILDMLASAERLDYVSRSQRWLRDIVAEMNANKSETLAQLERLELIAQRGVGQASGYTPGMPTALAGNDGLAEHAQIIYLRLAMAARA